MREPRTRRTRGRQKPETLKQKLLEWWQKWRKWVLIGAGGVVAVAAIITVIMLIQFPPGALPTVDECRERLSEDGFTHELRDETEAVTGFVWTAPKEGVVIFQEVTIVGVGSRCKSVTAEVFASKEGKGPKARKTQLGSFSFAPGSGVEVKEASGATKSLVERARKEFEQMTKSISGPAKTPKQQSGQ